MATTKIWAVKDNLKRVINYASNPEKTETEDGLNQVLEYSTRNDKTMKKLYVSGINCHPSTAYEEMMNTKKSAGKMDGVLAYHSYQSFKVGEIDAQEAHQIGVELANLMWGDEFEVVVTTHLDKAHIHNHFVVNSVSYLTKLKFTNKHADYRRFRSLSDALCYEHSLSVIQDPKTGMHYSEWLAKKKGGKSDRDIIREDVEYAISKSKYWKEFINEMKLMKYEIKYGKHIAVRPYGSDKKHYFRLYKIDRDGKYSEENIRARILENKIVPREIIYEEPKKMKYKGDFKKNKKLTGFKVLYFKYLYLLGVLPKKRPQYTVHPSLKRDLLKIEQYSQEVVFLSKIKIDSIEELQNYRNQLISERQKLLDERKVMYGKIKRCSDEERLQSLIGRRNVFSSQIKRLTKDIKTFERIELNTKMMEEKMKNLESESKEFIKENDKTKEK